MKIVNNQTTCGAGTQFIKKKNKTVSCGKSR